MESLAVLSDHTITSFMRRGCATALLAILWASVTAKADENAPYIQKIPATQVSFKMVPIPGGKFAMGSDAGEARRKADEGPTFEVEVEPFFMEEHETTWAEYSLFADSYMRLAQMAQAAPKIPADKFADAVTYPTPIYEFETGPILDRMGRRPRSPAVSMSQLAARQYTKWLSKKTGRFYRLPTEAEWEFACRAGTKTAYSFGDDPTRLEDYGWFIDDCALDDGDPGYHDIMQKKPNPWGLYDMHGNVAEWCIDAYSTEWYKQFAGKTVKWREAINWPVKIYPRTIRGGGFESEAKDCRSASRFASNKSLNMDDANLPKSPHWITEYWIGFRVIAPVKEPTEAEKTKFWDVDDDYTRKVLERDREIREIVTPPTSGSPRG